MKTILITAYAVNPYKGSEDGTGWNISKEIAKTNRVIVITRRNNVQHINKFVKNSKDPVLKRMEFYGFDLPNWILWLKKRSGDRGYVVYYFFWQLMITFFIKRKGLRFDLAHVLNFHSDSHPHFLWLLGKPVFWGPVGHHPKVPKNYLLPVYGWKKYCIDRSFFVSKWVFRNLNPLFWLAKKRSKKIFVINSSISAAMKISEHQTVLLPAVACKTPKPAIPTTRTGFTVLSVGRFHYLKGFDITIEAFARFYYALKPKNRHKTKLILVGKGPEKLRLEGIAKKANINQAIEWKNWVDRSKMDQLYKNSDVFLFPSHEGAGMVIPEAMSYGLPVLCFNNAGPGELIGQAGIRISYDNYQNSITSFAEELKLLFHDTIYREHYSNLASSRHKQNFTWASKGKAIQHVYDHLI